MERFAGLCVRQLGQVVLTGLRFGAFLTLGLAAAAILAAAAAPGGPGVAGPVPAATFAAPQSAGADLEEAAEAGLPPDAQLRLARRRLRALERAQGALWDRLGALERRGGGIRPAPRGLPGPRVAAADLRP